MKPNPSPTVSDEELRKLIQDEIRYRVEQEYEKYHNQFTFDQNGLSFWIDQIVDKLSDTLTPFIHNKQREARIEGRIEAGVQLRKSMISTSPFVEEILNPYLLEQRRLLKLTSEDNK